MMDKDTVDTQVMKHQMQDVFDNVITLKQDIMNKQVLLEQELKNAEVIYLMISSWFSASKTRCRELSTSIDETMGESKKL